MNLREINLPDGYSASSIVMSPLTNAEFARVAKAHAESEAMDIAHELLRSSIRIIDGRAVSSPTEIDGWTLRTLSAAFVLYGQLNSPDKRQIAALIEKAERLRFSDLGMASKPYWADKCAIIQLRMPKGSSLRTVSVRELTNHDRRNAAQAVSSKRETTDYNRLLGDEMLRLSICEVNDKPHDGIMPIAGFADWLIRDTAYVRALYSKLNDVEESDLIPLVKAETGSEQTDALTAPSSETGFGSLETQTEQSATVNI